MLGQLQLAEHPVDDPVPIGLREVGWQAQFRGVAQGLPERELVVQDVLLRHHADAGAQSVVFGVDVAALEGDQAARR